MGRQLGWPYLWPRARVPLPPVRELDLEQAMFLQPPFNAMDRDVTDRHQDGGVNDNSAAHRTAPALRQMPSRAKCRFYLEDLSHSGSRSHGGPSRIARALTDPLVRGMATGSTAEIRVLPPRFRTVDPRRLMSLNVEATQPSSEQMIGIPEAARYRTVFK